MKLGELLDILNRSEIDMDTKVFLYVRNGDATHPADVTVKEDGTMALVSTTDGAELRYEDTTAIYLLGKR